MFLKDSFKGSQNCIQCMYLQLFDIETRAYSMFSYLNDNHLPSVPEGLFKGLSNFEKMCV